MKLKKKEYFVLYFKYLKTQKLRAILLALTLLVGIGLQLINPKITGYFIDEAKVGAPLKKLIVVAFMFIGVAIIRQLFIIVSTYLGENVAWKATNDIRIDLIEHCMNLDMSFHKNRRSGELIERVDGDVSALFNLFSNVFLNIINNFLLLIGILIVLLTVDWRVSLALALFAIFGISFLWYVKTKTLNHWTKVSEMNAEFYGTLGENVSSTEDISTSGAKKYIMTKFYKLIRRMYPVFKKARLTWASMWSATLIIFAVGNAMVFILSGYLWKQEIITVGTIYMIYRYTELLRRPIEEIRVNLQELQVSGASIVRIKELFDIKSEIKYGTKTLVSSKPIGVEFKNVFFEYEKNVQVLKDISLNLKPDKVLGILGHTGSGKTTLARLLVKLYNVNDGEILLNGTNISEFRADDLRKNVAYVTQNVQLFSATLRENISMFNRDIKDEIILQVIEDLELEQWYSKFTKGLDTMIEGDGKSLSAGEAQLIAFIRVFLKDPKLIVLDEATSRIDPITEQLIERALNKLLENRTCIIIAHRLLTLERADDILILENGIVIESGIRKELLDDKQSRYHELLKQGIEEVLV